MSARVLVVKLSSLGDLFHALPAAHLLKTGLDADIDWVTQCEYVDVAGCFEDAGRVIGFPQQGRIHLALSGNQINASATRIGDLGGGVAVILPTHQSVDGLRSDALNVHACLPAGSQNLHCRAEVLNQPAAADGSDAGQHIERDQRLKW